jgi:signal transduction histidine kinase
MLIRPYTISQTAILLLLGFFLIYLLHARRQAPAADRTHIDWMLQVVVWGAVMILLTLLAGVVETTAIDALAYCRDIFALLFWHALSRAIYALPPVEPFARRHEPRRTSIVFAVLIVLELGYLTFRLLRLAQTATLEPRPLLLALPLLAAGVWSVLLVLRKLWAAERAPGATFTAHLRRAALRPQRRIGAFYRWFLLAAGSLALLLVFFNAAHLVSGSLPLWLLVGSDLLVTGALMLALFGYLSASPVPASLEYRLVGAGLTLFLALISLLGWIATVTFLRQQAPQLNPATVFGGQMQAQFFVTPAAYRGLAQQLSDLLAPLLWFAVLGSLLFVGAYIVYYGRVVEPPLRQIVAGFRAVEQGDLAVRIPPLPWQDEFSQIVVSFNQMAASLEQSVQQLRAYQQHLQALVEHRTAALTQEMDRRKGLEVRQAIQDERTRIAQETHDGLLQSLMGVRIRLNRSKRLSQMPAARLQAELDEMASEITYSVQDLRNLINELNDQILPDGLTAALQQLIQRQQRTYPIDIQADLHCAPDLIPVDQELHILRIVQEALANAARHSGAAHVWLAVGCVEQNGATLLHVQIRDDGRGFDPATQTGAGWGLKNMQRRATQLHGELRIDSRPGRGAVIDLTIPLRDHLKSHQL